MLGMAVLVSDTSVIIDLERSGLLKSAFSLQVEFAVPDLLFERELRANGGDELLALGLRIVSLEPAVVEVAQAYYKDRTVLALPDCFALALAQSHGWVLLSGDGPLRKLAAGASVECHGVLWLFDWMERDSILTLGELHAALTRLTAPLDVDCRRRRPRNAWRDIAGARE